MKIAGFNTPDILNEYLKSTYPDKSALIISGACYDSDPVRDGLVDSLAEVGITIDPAILEKDFVIIEMDNRDDAKKVANQHTTVNMYFWNPRKE